MEFVVLNKKEWLETKDQLQRIEGLLHSLIKTTKEVVMPKEEGFITIEAAMKKYNTTRTTLNKKAQKYNISRLPVGKQNLLKESELIEAFRQKEDAPAFVKDKKKPKQH